MRDFWSRIQHAMFWLLGLAMLAGLVYVIYLLFPWSAFRFDRLDPRLPEAFHPFESPWAFWAWVVALLAGSGVALVRLRTSLRPYRAAVEPEETPADEPVAPPAGALPSDPVFLLRSSSEAAVRDLLAAALGPPIIGRALLTTRPRRVVLIDATPSPGPLGAPTMDDPEFPTLRGVLFVIPHDELLRGDPSEIGRGIRSDLEAIRRLYDLEVPAYLIVTRMQEVPGFVEFARLKGPHEARQGRWGITLPRRPAGERDEPWQRMADFRFRIRASALDLIARDPLETDRNARLHGLDHWLGSIASALSVLCAAAFPPSDPDRPFLRRIELVADGPRPDDQAYVYYSVLHGPIEEDAPATRWTRRALDQDRIYRRRAGRIAAIGGVPAILVWLYIQLGLGSFEWWGWILFAALAGGWAAALWTMWRRWPAPPAGPD